MIKQYKYPWNVIIEHINNGPARIQKFNGIRIIHIPTRMVFECIDHDSSHKNTIECRRALEEWLKTQEYLELNGER